MATVEFDIGTARDYSTVAAWHADLDNDTPYDAGDDAIGNIYDDKTWAEWKQTISTGGTLGLNSIQLRAASGEEHDGVAGSAGVNFSVVGDAGWYHWNLTTTIPCDIGYGIAFTATTTAISVVNPTTAASSGSHVVRNAVGQSVTSSRTGAALIVHNFAAGQVGPSQDADHEFYNCSFIRQATDADIGATGFRFSKHVNCIAMHWGPTSGHKDYLNNASGSDYCLSHDTSAPGATNNQRSKVATDVFVAVVDGAWDLHLKNGSPAFENGTDLVTTPTGVNVDNDWYDRDSGGDTWSIGAFQAEAPAGGGGIIPQIMHHRRMMGVS